MVKGKKLVFVFVFIVLLVACAANNTNQGDKIFEAEGTVSDQVLESVKTQLPSQINCVNNTISNCYHSSYVHEYIDQNGLMYIIVTGAEGGVDIIRGE